MTIEQLANDERLMKTATIYGGKHATDIVQETILILLELPKHRLEKIMNDGALLVYAQKTALNLSRRMHNPQRNMDDNLITGVDLSFVEDDTEDSPLTDIEYAIDTLYGDPKTSQEWYKRELLTTYCQLGSLRKVQKATGIDYSSIHRTMKEVKNEIRTILDRDC